MDNKLYETLAKRLAITRPWDFEETIRANNVLDIDSLQWLNDVYAVARAIASYDEPFDKRAFIAACKGREI